MTLLLIQPRVLQWAVCFRREYGALVIIGSALLLICCGDSETKAQKLLNQAQVLERAGKEHEAHQLLDEIVKGYPQTNAATKASELLNKRKALKNLLSSVV
ncbi:MAG TPA: hypothetical protein VHP35_15290, partial [Terriglobia bacterium]|nr:hypothetical protein [Terriglobia bacterium]